MVKLKVRLSEKGQIVIPKIFRQTYKLIPNQEVLMSDEEDGVLIKNLDDDVVGKLKEIAEVAAKKRKGKPFHYDKREFYEQYDKHNRRTKIT